MYLCEQVGRPPGSTALEKPQTGCPLAPRSCHQWVEHECASRISHLDKHGYYIHKHMSEHCGRCALAPAADKASNFKYMYTTVRPYVIITAHLMTSPRRTRRLLRVTLFMRTRSLPHVLSARTMQTVCLRFRPRNITVSPRNICSSSILTCNTHAGIYSTCTCLGNLFETLITLAIGCS